MCRITYQLLHKSVNWFLDLVQAMPGKISLSPLIIAAVGDSSLFLSSQLSGTRLLRVVLLTPRDRF